MDPSPPHHTRGPGPGRPPGAGGGAAEAGAGGAEPDLFGLAALSAEELESLRGRSVWALKPAWCQPWSILGTGVAVVALADLLSPWLAALAALPIAAWWYVFLLAYPQQFDEAMEREAQRRGA